MPHSLPAAHRGVCDRLGRRPALRYKRDGLYHDFSWSEYRRHADGLAAGLIQLGIQPGDRVALLSENRLEWMIADQAILSCGAVNVPLHAPLSPQQVQFQVDHSESRGIIVSGAEQAAKVYEVLDQLPHLEFLIAFDPVEADARLQVLSWNRVLHGGWRAGDQGLREVLHRELELRGESLATIIYTSGTTGHPKGVMLTHHNLLSNADATRLLSGIEPEDVLLSWLPYSHIYARTVDIYLTMLAGATVALAESVETLLVNLAEVQPTWMTAVPRFYEKVWTLVEHLPPDDRAAALHRVFGPRLKQLSSGGAPLPRHVCEGFFAANIPLLEGYGLTESSPVISFNSMNSWRIGSVGQALPDVEIRIADDGEILTRGPHVMAGYWKNDTATRETIVDGWLHTGDVGVIDDDGFLFITDRKKDLFVTSGGKNVSPSELERLLVSDPCIDQAVVYGDGRQFVSALIVPCFAAVKQHLADYDPETCSDTDFVREQQVCEFFQMRVDVLMQAVSGPERVKRCLVLSRPFDVASDELTATLKIRRRYIISKYETDLETLYT